MFSEYISNYLTEQTDISQTYKTFSLKINKLYSCSEITQVWQCLKTVINPLLIIIITLIIISQTSKIGLIAKYKFTRSTTLLVKHHYQNHIKPQKLDYIFTNESLSIRKKIRYLAPKICPNVLLTGKSSTYTERVFLYRHSPTEHTVILVGGNLHLF